MMRKKQLPKQILSKLQKYGQYKYDIFAKLNVAFLPGKKLLDVGCGDGIDGDIFIKIFKLKTYGIDIYKHPHIKEVRNFHFKVAGIYDIPYKDDSFDYIFLHDVLHHIDEEKQSLKKHRQGLEELRRVIKEKGTIIIVEGNRYNPLFYPHMVKMRGHNHFSQQYFIKVIKDVFPNAEFSFFESHYYPQNMLAFWKIYEKIMERVVPKKFIAYNVAIINNVEK